MADQEGRTPGVELAEAVRAIRDGLVTAAGQGADQPVQFTLGDIAMEFTVEVRADARAKGGVRAWVIDAGAEAGLSTARTHRVSLTLKPTRPDGGDVRIAADDEGRTWHR